MMIRVIYMHACTVQCSIEATWLLDSMKALKCRTLGADMLLVSEETDSHMLCCFAGGLFLELPDPEQLAAVLRPR